MMIVKKKEVDEKLQEMDTVLLDHIPELFERIGLNNYNYYKKDANGVAGRIKDKEKSYVYSTTQCLVGGISGVTTADMVEFRLSAVFHMDELLNINNLDMTFEHAEDPLLIELLEIHDMHEYLDNYKIMEQFVLSRSVIVASVKPKIQFDTMGVFKGFSLNFEYKEDTSSIWPKSKSYYTNSLDIYSNDLFTCYEVENNEQALSFSKMSYLSIADEHFQELFGTDDWIQLYQTFRQDTDGCISLYDMAKI